MNEPTRRTPPLLLTLARIGAVALALSVMGCYVYNAQERAYERANERANEGTQEGADEIGEDGIPAALSSSKSLAILPEESFLPSSKSRVMADDNVLPLASTKGMVVDPNLFLSGSKSAVIVDDLPKVDANGKPVEMPAALPSSKSMVVEPDTFLFSSKSAAPIGAVETDPKTKARLQQVKKALADKKAQQRSPKK